MYDEFVEHERLYKGCLGQGRLQRGSEANCFRFAPRKWNFTTMKEGHS